MQTNDKPMRCTGTNLVRPVSVWGGIAFPAGIQLDPENQGDCKCPFCSSLKGRMARLVTKRQRRDALKEALGGNPMDLITLGCGSYWTDK